VNHGDAATIIADGIIPASFLPHGARLLKIKIKNLPHPLRLPYSPRCCPWLSLCPLARTLRPSPLFATDQFLGGAVIGYCCPSFVDTPPAALAQSHPPRNSLAWLIVAYGRPTAYGAPSYLIMDPPDPLADFFPSHRVFRNTPWPFSSAPMGFIHDDGTAFMLQYLTPLASLPVTVPSPLAQLGGIPYAQRAAPLTAIYDLGGGSCVPGGSALRAPAPHDTTFMGPCRPDPEEDISGSPLRHGVRLATSHPPFIDGGILDIHHLHPRAAPLFRLFGVLMGGLHSPPLLLLIIVVGLPSPPLLLGL
jgi:hypothetical protein